MPATRQPSGMTQTFDFALRRRWYLRSSWFLIDFAYPRVGGLHAVSRVGCRLAPVLNDLRQLRYFVAVAQAGQLTEAARRLDVAQPTLSQAIARLESQLGVQLLERENRGVTLTPTGRAFLGKAQVVVSAADDAEAAARASGRAV